MSGLLRALRVLRSSRRSGRPYVPVAERFAHFRVIGAGNNAFLENLLGLKDRAESAAVPGMEGVVSAYESLSGPVGAMVKALVAMAGGRYQSLLQRYEEIDRDIAQSVLRSQPIQYGPPIAWPGGEVPLHPEETGPKAARLAEVAGALPLAVPPFFAVTVYGYRLFMEATGLQDLVNERLGSTDLRDAEALAAASGDLAAAVLAAEVPPVLAGAMREARRRLVAEHPARFGVAVRSSAVVEDAESSFAGQFLSVLGVGEAGLLDAYKEVVASKYRVEAMRYALARGFLDQDVAMPVLVMAMVQPRASGVAYSRSPDHPGCAVVTSVAGLAAPLVDGSVVPERFVVLPAESPRIVERSAGGTSGALRCVEGGGLVRSGGGEGLDDEAVAAVAEMAWALEDHFDAPQDVEWALDGEGTLFVVQTRPLRSGGEADLRDRPRVQVNGYRLLAQGVRAAGGTGSGPVCRIADPGRLDAVPEGAVAVVEVVDPRLAGVVGRLAAIVSASGSATGHMATIAREFGVPCVVGVEGAPERLADGTVVTVDGWSGRVYEGLVAELLAAGGPTSAKRARDPVRERLEELLGRVSPLTLTDPSAPTFRPRNCATLHDVARFVHQRAMAEMFGIEGLSSRERRQTRRLDWHLPMDLLILDLGSGLAAGTDRLVPVDRIASVPLAALIEGMTDPRLHWAGPVGFDLKGFVSVVVRSAADDQRYGEPSYALCSPDYLHFSSRLAYHFATADSVCGRLINENYARFLFHGGAAVAERREWRAHFLATVLQYNGFIVTRRGDRVEAVLSKRSAEVIEESLVMLGRLMVAARHLDMVMESQATADAFARAFLTGDYGFELVRREGR